MNSHANDSILRRAALPELCFARDIAPVLLVEEELTERLLAAGRLGRVLRVRGQFAVLRDDLLDALALAAERGADVTDETGLRRTDAEALP